MDVKTCPLCGSASSILYTDLTDRWFDAPGLWNLARCGDPACGALSLDPPPSSDELSDSYNNYYTHLASDEPEVRRLGDSATAGFLARKMGYSIQLSRRAVVLGALVACCPKRRELAMAAAMYLDFVPGGIVLDVGCGSGAHMKRLGLLGWRVEGVEPDIKAAEAARSRGLLVHHGDMLSAKLDTAAYDAAYLTHVLEHLARPIDHLRQVRRVLRRGAQITTITPNAGSLGHLIFGRRWRGLEPPRHLHIFTQRSLLCLLSSAGFVDVNVRSSARCADETFAGSSFPAARVHASPRVLIRHRVLDQVERAGVLLGAGWGEELVASARAP